MFKLKSCVWISEGFKEVKKTLVTCCHTWWQQVTDLSLSPWPSLARSLFKTTLPRRQRVLNRSIWRRGWVDVDATRAAGAIQKRRHRLCSHSYLRKSRAFRRCKRLSLWLLPVQPLLRNVWQNQEPKCRKRRVDIGRRVVRWTHPAGLPSTVHGSW